MIDLDINISGAAEVIRALSQFDDRLADRVVRSGVSAGARFLKNKLKEAVPVRSGRLKRAVVAKSSRLYTRRKNNTIGSFITIKKGNKRNDQSGAYYANFVESGYIAGKKRNATSRQIQGQLFVKRTFTRYGDDSAQLIVSQIEKRGEQLARSMGL